MKNEHFNKLINNTINNTQNVQYRKKIEDMSTDTKNRSLN
jgi:hypothetical protein